MVNIHSVRVVKSADQTKNLDGYRRAAIIANVEKALITADVDTIPVLVFFLPHTGLFYGYGPTGDRFDSNSKEPFIQQLKEFFAKCVH